MKCNDWLNYLSESISILRHCRLNEEQKNEFRGRISLAFKELDTLKTSYKVQNNAIYIGDNNNIQDIGYYGIDKLIDNIRL